MPTVVRDTIYPKEDYCCSTFQKSLVLKYNFMVCVSSLAIGTFALNSWSNTLLHKFLKKKKKKTSENSRRNIKSTLFQPLFSTTCILKLSLLLK